MGRNMQFASFRSKLAKFCKWSGLSVGPFTSSRRESTFANIRPCHIKNFEIGNGNGAGQLNIELEKGVYMSVLGPCFETPAEIRAFRVLGAEVIVMSTVPEGIVAHHCGLKILLLSAISNFAAGMTDESLSHETTLSGAKLAEEKLTKLAVSLAESLCD